MVKAYFDKFGMSKLMLISGGDLVALKVHMCISRKNLKKRRAIFELGGHGGGGVCALLRNVN